MIASLVCRVSRKVLLSAMVMDFGDCGVLTALSFNISDSLYSRRLLQKSHNLTSNPSSKIKKLHTIKVSSFVYSFGISFWFIDLIISRYFLFYWFIIHISLWNCGELCTHGEHVLIVYTPDWLIKLSKIMYLWWIFSLRYSCINGNRYCGC